MLLNMSNSHFYSFSSQHVYLNVDMLPTYCCTVCYCALLCLFSSNLTQFAITTCFGGFFFTTLEGFLTLEM